MRFGRRLAWFNNTSVFAACVVEVSISVRIGMSCRMQNGEELVLAVGFYFVPLPSVVQSPLSK